MAEPLCEKCGIKMVPDPGNPMQRNCPRCSRATLRVYAEDRMTLQDALGIHGVSSDSHDGLPLREMTRSITVDGHSSAADVERRGDGSATVKRSMQPASPSPRDTRGVRKREEEQAAVLSMLTPYNRLHGTSYNTVHEGDDSRGDDVVITSPVEGEPSLVVQVTLADADGKLQACISTGRSFSQGALEADLVARFNEALRRKENHADPSSILLLDGRGVATAPGTIEVFARGARERLAALNYGEVWWSDSKPGGVVRRLWPS